MTPAFLEEQNGNTLGLKGTYTHQIFLIYSIHGAIGAFQLNDTDNSGKIDGIPTAVLRNHSWDFGFLR